MGAEPRRYLQKERRTPSVNEQALKTFELLNTIAKYPIRLAGFTGVIAAAANFEEKDVEWEGHVGSA